MSDYRHPIAKFFLGVLVFFFTFGSFGLVFERLQVPQDFLPAAFIPAIFAVWWFKRNIMIPKYKWWRCKA